MSLPRRVWLGVAGACLLLLGAPGLPWITARAPLLWGGIPVALWVNLLIVVVAGVALAALDAVDGGER